MIHLGIIFTKEELVAATASPSGSAAAAAAAASSPALSVSPHVPETAPPVLHTPIPRSRYVPSGGERNSPVQLSTIVGEGSQRTGSGSVEARRSVSIVDDATTAHQSHRHRPLPAGGQLRPDLPPDADDAWLEDEERRQSVSAAARRDFVTSVRPASLSSSMHSSSSDLKGALQQSVKRVSTWDHHSSRAFGVEMETTLSKRSDEFLLDNAVKAVRDVVPTLRTFLGSSYEVAFVDYQTAKDDRAYKAWKITTDLSIKSEDGRPIFGLEFITPKLSGPHDLWRLENFCEQLQAMSFNVNSTTALHVHISTEDLTNRQLVRLCEYNAVFEHVIDSFMTLPRRSDYSRYCRSNLKSMSVSRDVTEALTKLEKLNVDKSCGSLIRCYCPRLSAVRNSHRNHKVNLLLLNRTKVGTPGRRIEFRQHQGSIDKVEIGAWVTLLTKWVEAVSKMPSCPSPNEGTVARFWEIINDQKLRAYYTVKAQTLPTSMTFTYDSRELYAYETDEEEPSDIESGDSPPGSPSGPRPPGGAAPTPTPTPPVAASTTPGRPSVAVTMPSLGSPAPSGGLFSRSTGAPTAISPSPPVTSASSSSRAAVLPYHAGHGDAFSNSPTSAAPQVAVVSGASRVVSTRPPQPPPVTSMTLTPAAGSNNSAAVSPARMTNSDDASRSASGDDTALMARLGIAKWDAADGDSSIVSSVATEPIIHTVSRQVTRRTRSSISVGNFVMPLPIQAEALIEVDDGESWNQIVNSDPEVVIAEKEDHNDNTSWFITAPEGRVGALRKRRRDDGAVRWVSPWLLEAKKLEQMSMIHEMIRESLMLDESTMASVVSVNASGLTNAEICRIVAIVLVCEQPLGAMLNDPKATAAATTPPLAKDFKVFAKIIAEVLKLGASSTTGNAHTVFPKSIQNIVSKVMTTSSFFDITDVLDTAQPSRGNFNLRRSLRFVVRTGSVGELASRCMFLSYMCNHIGKKAVDDEIVRTAESLTNPQRRDLVDMVATLPASVQRMLS
ncbi:amidoligase-like protein, putative [Bodo saltans]|uniref:Amidoligase-like protein, putative n=1 Tax=Bodo saltans TaxID=75058 RepID=A0A0S4KIE9_BODSA|nr:amidoligase-like protein, putative [Bodo saltans]|eukprot:CUI14077.1 amidoligase-like protein, putative [Bodo saltans]